MPRYYDKDTLKEQLELKDIFDLVTALGGEPEYVDSGLILRTICHNFPGEGSRKLYYYENSRLFRCYTDCDDSFDVFELVIKAMRIQKGLEWELYDAMNYVAIFFNLAGSSPQEIPKEVDPEYWEAFDRHESLSLTNNIQQEVVLKAYNPIILTRFLYPRILGWEAEGISDRVCKKNFIGYYPSGEQITIPHFDSNGRLIGIRGRFLASEDAERWGKYRPLNINDIWYTHPLSMNLYNLNKSKENIRKSKTAITFESEKSCLMFQTYYGEENDITVANCGSSLSSYQIYLLEKLGIEELVVAYDRQFQQVGDAEFLRLKKKLIGIREKCRNSFRVSTIFDRDMISPYKASPIDNGKEMFETLLSNRIIPA